MPTDKERAAVATCERQADTARTALASMKQDRTECHLANLAKDESEFNRAALRRQDELIVNATYAVEVAERRLADAQRALEAAEREATRAEIEQIRSDADPEALEQLLYGSLVVPVLEFYREHAQRIEAALAEAKAQRQAAVRAHELGAQLGEAVEIRAVFVDAVRLASGVALADLDASDAVAAFFTPVGAPHLHEGLVKVPHPACPSEEAFRRAHDLVNRCTAPATTKTTTNKKKGRAA